MSEKKNLGQEQERKAKLEKELKKLDDLQVARVKPFTKYKAVELAICGLAVLLELLYLYAGFIHLALLLPAYCIAFAAVTILRYLDTKALGLRGFVAMLPVLCWGVLTIAVLVATCAYFMQ